MDYLNIHSSTIRSADFLGADPIERATWLCLLAYCTTQENGGRIAGGLAWNDRKWQQVCGVTKEEVAIHSALYGFDGDDLVVQHYPHEQEATVRAKREAGKKGGKAKTKAKKEAAQTNGATGGRPTQAETQAETQAPGEAKTQRKEKEGNEKKRKGMEGNDPPTPPTCQDVIDWALKEFPTIRDRRWLTSICREFHAVWEERDWQTQAGHDLRVKWPHRLRSDVEKEFRNGKQRNEPPSSGNPPTVKAEPPRSQEEIDRAIANNKALLAAMGGLKAKA